MHCVESRELTGIEWEANVVARFDGAGISFQYPENWELNHEEGMSPSHCVTLQSPQSGFWMLQVFDESDRPDEMAAEVLRTVRQEYQDIEVAEVHESVAATESTGYDLQFYCLDFIVSARVRSFAVNGQTWVMFCQAEDREFDKTWPVFLAITISLLQTR